MMRPPLNVAVPWSLSHYIPLDGFHPLYRALFDHAPDQMAFSAWDNVKLYRRFRRDISVRRALLRKAKAEDRHADRFVRGSVTEKYNEYFWNPDRVLTTELMGDIEFHHTAPFPSLKRPFVLHCESFAPVLFPFAQQGIGSIEDHKELREHYRGILAHPLCLGVFSHIPETLHALSQFFSDPTIDGKLFPSRIGLSAKAVLDHEPQQKPSLSRPRFLFINSANQNPANFFRRGGHLVLRFWKEFVASGRDGFLMLRCIKPSDRELIEYGVDVSLVKAEIGRSIIWAQDYLARHEMNALMANAHFFLLPSASLHSVSIMEAMALGTIPVVSDTVGTSVYVTNDDDGIVLHGLSKVIWHKDETTDILADRYRRTPDLDDSLVAQLTSRVCTLLEEPSAYWGMRTRALSHARELFSGETFSQEFWGAVSDLYERFRQTAATIEACSDPAGQSLHECAIQGDGWARVFESPTQPMLRANTGQGVVWQLGGAMIHAYGNPCMRLRDWSVLAQYRSTDAPQITFANNLEELEGKYLGSIEARYKKESCGKVIVGWISRILRPFPTLHRCAAYVLSMLRRCYRKGKFAKPKANPDIEIVRHGVSGYNIIRHIDRYYAILQCEGEFIPEKVEASGYSSCFSGHSIDQVLRCIAASTRSSMPGNLDDDLLQNEVAFVQAKPPSNKYTRSFSGFSIEDVQREILDAPDSGQAWDNTRANSTDRAKC